MTTMTFATTRPAFSGCYTALITPFRNGELDLPALRTLVERQILGGVAGLVPCGTTGETPALTAREWETVVATVIETAQGRVPVIAGTGSNGTASTIERTRRAQALGADAALVVTPYYNKPTQEGLYQHFAAIASATEIPLVLCWKGRRLCRHRTRAVSKNVSFMQSVRKIGTRLMAIGRPVAILVCGAPLQR